MNKSEDIDKNRQCQQSSSFKNTQPVDGVEKQEEKADDNIDDSGVLEENIRMVMEQTQCDRRESVLALNDPVIAIMILMG